MQTFNRFFLRFVALVACVWVASLTTGCGASYEIKATASYLPSSAQVEAERAALAVPADLLTKLNAVLAESGKTAENERPDPRYIAQSAGRFTNVEQKLVFALLQWGADKYVEAKQSAKAPEPAPVVAAKPLTREDPRVQVALGAVGGAALGAVPFGSVGADVAIELHILPNGTYWAQVGRACGEMAVGLGQIAVACTGVGAGIGMSGTGGGAVVGIPLVAESLVIGYNGLLTTANGFRHAQQLAQEGPPSAPDVVTPELLRPPRKPATPAPVAAAPPPKPAAPAQVKPPIPEAPPPGTMLVNTSKSGGTTKTVRRAPPGQKAPEITTEIHTHETRSGRHRSADAAAVGMEEIIMSMQFIHAREDVDNILRFADSIGLLLLPQELGTENNTQPRKPEEFHSFSRGTILLFRPEWVMDEMDVRHCERGAFAGTYSVPGGVNMANLSIFFHGDEDIAGVRRLGSGDASYEREWLDKKAHKVRLSPPEVVQTYKLICKELFSKVSVRGGVHNYHVCKHAAELATRIPTRPPFDYISWPPPVANKKIGK